MRRALTLLVLGTACHALSQQQGATDVVLTSTRALVLMEPVVVAGTSVNAFSASPDGRYLVAMRSLMPLAPISLERPPTGPEGAELVIWDSTTGATRTLALPKNTISRPVGIEWLKGSNRALVTLWFSNYTTRDAQGNEVTAGVASEAYILDAASGKMQLVRDSKDYLTASWRLAVSPLDGTIVEVVTERRPLAAASTVVAGANVLVEKPAPPQATIRTLSADGRWSTGVKLPATHFVSGRQTWSVDLSEFLIECHIYPEQGGKPFPVVTHFNLATREVYDTTGAMPSYSPPAVKTPILLERRTGEVEDGNVKRPTASWWLKSKEASSRPVALVAAHAESAVVASGEKFVAYVANGALFVRRVLEMSAQLFEQMIASAERARLMSNAKQVGLAAMMYAMDYDDTIPEGLDPVRDLSPYLKNNQLLEGFVWVFPGGKLSDIKNPAETMMGYIEGHGGRVVTYMDGHVKWVPNE